MVVRLPLIEGHLNRSLYDRGRYLPVGSPTQALLPLRQTTTCGILTCPRPQGNHINPSSLSLFNSTTQPFFTFHKRLSIKVVCGDHISGVSIIKYSRAYSNQGNHPNKQYSCCWEPSRVLQWKSKAYIEGMVITRIGIN